MTGGRRRYLSGAAAVLGVLLVGYAVWAFLAASGREFASAGAAPGIEVPAVTSTSRPSAVPPSPRSTRSPGRGVKVLEDRSFRPRRLTISSPAVKAPVVPVKVDRRGTLAIPEDVDTVGWWSGGAAPGSPVGTVVLAGHVDSAEEGPGALFRADRTPVGARIVVEGPDGKQTYTVVGRRRYAKDDLPAAKLFAQGEKPRLVLVTCGGTFDPTTRHYSDNVVVFATPEP